MSEELHPNGQRVQSQLDALGVAGKVRSLPESAPTAATAAAQLGVQVAQIANSLIFNADGQPLLVMASGAHKCDTALVAELIGANSVARADVEFVRAATGQPIGGVAPVGHPAPLRTIVDKKLSEFTEIWAAGGHPHYVFPTTFDELVRITNGQVAEVGLR